jgi:hypothetical protein
LTGNFPWSVKVKTKDRKVVDGIDIFLLEGSSPRGSRAISGSKQRESDVPMSYSCLGQGNNSLTMLNPASWGSQSNLVAAF